MVYLTNLLTQTGNDVTLVIYYDLNSQIDFLHYPEKLVLLDNKVKIQMFFQLIKLFRQIKANVVISYLNGPNHLAALLRIVFPLSKFIVITSERNFDVNGLSFKKKVLRIHHLFANWIVCNSLSQKELLKKEMPIIRKKLVYIPNVIDFNKFIKKVDYSTHDTFKFLVPASIHKRKNPMNLAKASKYLKKEEPALNFRIDWFGTSIVRIKSGQQISNNLIGEVEKYIFENGLENTFQIHDVDPNLNSKFHQYDGLILPSFFEGCPNAIMDAMASGLPVLASRVSDNELIVDDKIGGFLFNPNDFKDISKKMIMMIQSTPEKRMQMGAHNYYKSKQMFSEEKFTSEYIKLFD